MTMTDKQVAEQIERADRFIEHLRAAIDDAIANVDPHSPCAIEQRAGLARIASTLNRVSYTLLANLANLDVAMTNRLGTGPMLDHPDPSGPATIDATERPSVVIVPVSDRAGTSTE